MANDGGAMKRSLLEINPQTIEKFESKGLRLGDEVRIKPIWGKSKKFHLKYTEVYFCDDICQQNKKSLILPKLKNENFSVGLYLTRGQDSKDQEQERFLMRSLDQNPFWINGVWCFECFIERGDKIRIGQNLIEFHAREVKKELKPCHEQLEMNLIQSNLSILVEGETGVGKSFLAKQIHEKSQVRGKFVHVNLSSFAPDLIESELFGHKKGSFTGAIKDKVGALREAHGGTLFLDEIDSISLSLQTKLLLFLDSQSFRIVGDTKETHVKTRLIFASGRDLSHLVAKGVFRKDFFFRLATGAHLKLKPLRDRPESVKKFCEHFSIKEKVVLDSRLIEFYQSLPWPGNLRQLKGHLLKKKALSKNNKLFFDHNDDLLINQSSSLSAFSEKIHTLDEVKKAYAQKVFYQSDNNLKLSSEKLKISRKTLRRLLDLAA